MLEQLLFVYYRGTECDIPQNEEQSAPQTDQEPPPDSPNSTDSELDITNEKFDPLRALYEPDYRISQKQPKVIYQNLAAFESAFKRFGIMNLNKRNNTIIQKKAQKTDENNTSATAVKPGSSKQSMVIAEEAETRRFLPHQMPVQGSRRKKKNLHNIFTYLDGITGPMSALKLGMNEQRRIRVMVRNEHGIRGSLEGTLIWFDKFWNLWLRDVEEKWQRRKYKYGVNKMCGEPQDCNMRLQALGIVLPKQEVKSINRKNVEISRHLQQILVRGEEVALVIFLTNSMNSTTLQNKP